MSQIDKKCLVCGDYASGFNYNGLTCESCKVFFHRNSPKYRELACKRTGTCPVDQFNRRDCSKCRMEKCFLVGMKRASMQVDYSADQAILRGIEKFLGVNSLKKVNKADLTKMAQYMSRFPKGRKIVNLNSYELERINEANTAVSVFPDERNCEKIIIVHSMAELYQLDEIYPESSDFYVRKTINFCQNFSAFNSLQQDDQMAMIKPFFFDVLMIRLSFIVDFNSKCSAPLIINDEGTHAISFHQDYTKELSHQDALAFGGRTSKGLHKEMDNDFIIRDLLSAMCLFKNHRNINCPEVIRYNYFLYTQLLVRYLEFKCQSKKEAKKKFHKLMSLLEDMNIYLGFKNRIIEDYDTEQFPSIIRELYDLN